MELYGSVRKRSRLWRAWNDVSRKAIASKSRATREEAYLFGTNIARHIDRIGRQLRQQKFQFAPQKGMVLKKKSDKKRPIVIAPIQTRIVQRSILDTLQEIPELRARLTSGFNFGGVPGEGFGVPGAILTARSEMISHPYFLRTDIRSFFVNVSRRRAEEAVLRYTDDAAFSQLFREAIPTEIDDAAKHGSDINLFPLHQDGVAQGSCLSPLVCNLLLADFDERLNSRGIVSIRYIDDILILGKNSNAVFKAFDAAQSLLGDVGLECYDPRRVDHAGKAACGTSRDGFEFLGCEVSTESLRPSSKNRKELLNRVRRLFDESLKLCRDPQSASKKHASYAETIYLASKTVQGWANTFGFCTDERVMSSLDKEISILLKYYSSATRRRIRALCHVDQRRVLGLFSMADRVQPLAKDLVRSLQ